MCFPVHFKLTLQNKIFVLIFCLECLKGSNADSLRFHATGNLLRFKRLKVHADFDKHVQYSAIEQPCFFSYHQETFLTWIILPMVLPLRDATTSYRVLYLCTSLSLRTRKAFHHLALHLPDWSLKFQRVLTLRSEQNHLQKKKVF